MIGLAGDWHGNSGWARRALATFGMNGITDVYQLGDFGLGWPGGWGQYLNEVEGACDRWGIDLRIVPGNHENYDWMDQNLVYDSLGIAPMSTHITVLQRGHRDVLAHGRTLVALGGAPSIDYPGRTPGASWWKQEAITLEEAEAVAEAGYADIMLTHDAPNGSTDAVERIIHDPNSARWWTGPALKYAAEGRTVMDVAFAGVRPKVFAHGHYHVMDQRDDGRTMFISLACDGMTGNIITLDLETLEHTWLGVLPAVPPK